MPESQSKPWERQPGEKRAAYAAFALYRDLPAEQRSIDEAYRRAKRGKGSKRASGRWLGWSAKFGWVSRSESYDAHLDAEQRKTFLAERLELSRQHARGLAAARQTLLAPVRIALDALQDPATLERMKALVATADGLRSVLTDARLAAAVLPMIVTAERLTAGLDTQVVSMHDAANDTFANTVLASPELTAKAIELLDGVASAPLNDS